MPSNYLPSIVLIDDDDDDREMLSSALQLQGCSVQTFDAGDHAIEALKLITDPRNLPSLIILDYNMPRVNGEQVLIFLKAEYPLKDVPVVIYSTTLSGLFQKALIKLGAHSGMVKAVTLEQFMAQVRQFKQIAQTEHKPRQISHPGRSFKFFSTLASLKTSNKNIALKRALQELAGVDQISVKIDSIISLDMSQRKNLN